jgi:hypothetical protein
LHGFQALFCALKFSGIGKNDMPALALHQQSVRKPKAWQGCHWASRKRKCARPWSEHMQNTSQESSPDLLNYLAKRRCSPQWQRFLHALATEFSSALSVGDLRTLSRRIGTRFANDAPLSNHPTLDTLQAEISRVWGELDWGYVNLVQQNDCVEIQHFCSPLSAGLGKAGSEWCAGFLEGVYQQWFEQQGAAGLRVSQTHNTDPLGNVFFRLSR